MDGGGRLSRSVEQGHQSDLGKKAARKKASRSRARAPEPVLRPASLPVYDEHGRNSQIATLERLLPRGVGVAAVLLLMTGTVGLGLVKGGQADNFFAALSDTRNAAANAVGFRITNVSISGRKQLTQDEVLAVGGVNGRSSLLFLNASEVRDRLKADPWIGDATVQKLYPGKLQIDITERAPYALWQRDGQVSVISEDGTVLEPFVASRFVMLPLVVGKGAETRAKDFLQMLAFYPHVRSQVKAMVFVGERRWNLRLTNGLDIRLPETNLNGALDMLTKLDRENDLFSRDITAIDMRLPDRLTVRLSEDAAKAREELLKAKAPKKKAGDA
ncbi:MAG: cell division protein FtsQ/DivIB [Rhizobiales bacterium]|nr:cell division protein FtsQ/DivIB [Hyphomicrobiales bacterium]